MTDDAFCIGFFRRSYLSPPLADSLSPPPSSPLLWFLITNSCFSRAGRQVLSSHQAFVKTLTFCLFSTGIAARSFLLLARPLAVSPFFPPFLFLPPFFSLFCFDQAKGNEVDPSVFSSSSREIQPVLLPAQPGLLFFPTSFLLPSLPPLARGPICFSIERLS